MMPIQARRTGDGSGGYQASPIANPNTANQTVSSLSFGSRVTAANNIRWPSRSYRKSQSFMKSESRSEKHDAFGRLFLPNGDPGYRIFLSNASAPPPSTGI